MDSITQFVLGASIGEKILGEKLKNKSILLGGLVATLPDLDIFFCSKNNILCSLIIHRGFTHSLIFAILAGILISYFFQKTILKSYNFSLKRLFLFSFLALFTHSILDSLTGWGTQLFWPLNYWVALKSVFIIDILYTGPFLIGLTIIFFSKSVNFRKRINNIILIITSAYLMMNLLIKFNLKYEISSLLSKNSYNIKRVNIGATLFSPLLWYGIIEEEKSYQLFYKSLLKKDISFFKINKNHHILEKYKNHQILDKLFGRIGKFFSLKEKKDKLIIYDLKFSKLSFTNKDDFIFVFIFDKKKNKLSLIQNRKGLKTYIKLLWQNL